jgi:hypothetical protein
VPDPAVPDGPESQVTVCYLASIGGQRRRADGGHGLPRGTIGLVELERGRVAYEEELLAAGEEEELWTEDGGDDHEGWFCVATAPFPCPADGCGFVAEFMTAAHLILVWEERDDPNLLRHAQRAKEVGRDPRVVTYESSFGPSASYYAWEAAGRPVHGVRRT